MAIVNGITIQPNTEASVPRDRVRSGENKPDPTTNNVTTPPANPSAPPRQNEVQRPVQPAEQADDAPTRESLEQLIERIGENLLGIDKRSISFRINEEIDRTIVSVIDIETEEVVIQIPSKELIRVAEVFQDLNDQLSRLSGEGDSFDGSGVFIRDSA